MILAALRVTLFDYPDLQKLQAQAVGLLYLVCAEGAKGFRDRVARLCGLERCANIEGNTRNHGNQSGETRHAHETG